MGQSLFGDELFLWAIVGDRSLGDSLSVVHDTEKTPPLGFVLSWGAAQLSDAPEAVRLPSFVASVATVPLVYLIGRRTLGGRASLVAAAWFALSPFMIFYGTESRSYALVTAFVVLSTLALLLALEEGKKRWWAVYALAAAAAVYSHYIAVLALLPQAGWALWTQRQSAREQLLAGGVAVLLFLPWLPSFVVQARNSSDEARRISEMVPLTLSNVAEFSVKPLIGHPYVSLADIPGRMPTAVLAGLFVALLILKVRSRWGGGVIRQYSLRSRAGLVVLLAVAPFVGLLLYSLQPETSFLLSRNLSIAVPYALLLVGWALSSALPRGVAVTATVVALAALSVGTVKMLDDDYQRPDADDAARFIDSRAPASAPVIDTPGPHAIRTYLQPSRRVYTTTEFRATDWAAAARSSSPVFFTFPRLGILAEGHRPPPPYGRRFRLVARHDSPGTPFPVGVLEYRPR